MKITAKQKLQKIEEWFDNLRAEHVAASEKEIITVPVGNSKVFLDKSNPKNDKIQIDYIVILRKELSMLESKMMETIYKLATRDSK